MSEVTEVRARLRRLVDDELASLPAPGVGDTRRRWTALHEAARRHDVSVARLAEAHLDASAILAEAATTPPRASDLYGVWASAGDVVVDVDAGVVTGGQPFCSGAGVVDRALVAARTTSGAAVLVDVAATGPTVTADHDGWRTTALADTATAVMTFDRHPVGRLVGGEDFYLDRPGFWHGAVGPAACWAGAAAGLVDVALRTVGDGAHARAHVGAMDAAVRGMRAVLVLAGDEADAAPDDAVAARRRALATRHLVEQGVTDVLERFGRVFGPRPFVSQPEVRQRWDDARLYVRQHHAENDLEVLGDLAVAADG